MKRGRPPLTIAPAGDALLREAKAYADWARRNPLVVPRTLASGKVVPEKHERPLTWEGLFAHAPAALALLDEVRAAAPDVIQQVRAIFFDQQYSRAIVGEYDRHLVASYFGMTERKAIEAKVTVTKLSDEELDAELGELMQVVDLTPDARITGGNGTASLELKESRPALPVIRDQRE
jgi:hypothetical protein